MRQTGCIATGTGTVVTVTGDVVTGTGDVVIGTVMWIQLITAVRSTGWSSPGKVVGVCVRKVKCVWEGLGVYVGEEDCAWERLGVCVGEEDCAWEEARGRWGVVGRLG